MPMMRKRPTMRCGGGGVRSFILDISGGYLVAKHVYNIWLAVLTVLLVGAVNAVGINFLIYAWAPDLSGGDMTF